MPPQEIFEKEVLWVQLFSLKLINIFKTIVCALFMIAILFTDIQLKYTTVDAP